MLSANILETCLNLILPKEIDNTSCESERLATCISKFNSTLESGYQFSIPTHFILKLTSSCNLRCKHCFYSGEKEYYNRGNEMSKDEWINFINYSVDEINPLGFAITGGEVFLRKDTLDIIKCIKDKSIPLSVQTNATLITDEIAKKLSELLFCKTDSISISLDGANKETHDYIRGNGSYDKTITAIKLLKKYDIPVIINLTLTTVSAPAMTKIFSLCEELGIKHINMNKFKVCNEEHSYLKLNETDLLNYTYDILQEHKKYPEIKANIKTVNIYDLLATKEGERLLDNYAANNKIEKIRCYSCHNHNRATISSTGDVFLCSMDETPNAILGNIREQDFMEIWENRFSNPYFKPRTFETIKCKDCKFIGLCSVGCMVSSYQKFKDINMPPAECTYYQKIRKN